MPNAGFVQQLWLLQATDVVTLLDPETFPVTGKPMTVSKQGVLVEAGAVVTRMVFPYRSATFEQTKSAEIAGSYYEPKLQITLPRPTAELDEFMFRYADCRWVAFWMDGNGQGWIAGEPMNGLVMIVTRSQAETNSLRIDLTGRGWHPVWRLESVDLTELFPDAAFDYSFDFSFDA